LAAASKYETAVKLVTQLEQYNTHHTWKKWSDIQQRIAQLTLQREQSKAKHCTQEYYNFQLNKCNGLNRSIGKQAAENLEIEKENNIIAEYNAKAPQIDTQLKKLSIYLEAITSTKLRNIVISAGMKTIMEILNTICTTCGFTVEMQQAEEITFNICNKTTKLPIKMASGMQKFVISLAMRLAICQVLPTPTFMFVDEGFDAVDNDNMLALKNTLHELAANCSFIFIVSHKESLQNTLVKPLFITQHASHSHVTNVAIQPVRQDIHCECGAIVTQDKYAKHIKTKKHLISAADRTPA
jgi:DNA repair exonuclease SbcCD ATPase subunit